MPDIIGQRRIDELPAVQTLVTTDILQVVQDPSNSDVLQRKNRKMGVGSFIDFAKTTIGAASTLAGASLGLLSKNDYDKFNSAPTQAALDSVANSIPEAARDAVGAMVQDSATIDATYNDAGDTLTIDVRPASITAPLVGLMPVTDVASTAYTVQLADLARTLRFTAATAVTVTVPDTLPSGFHCELSQGGAGQITVVGGGAMVVTNLSNQLKSAGQLAIMQLRVFGTNTGRLFGQTVA